MFRVGGLGRYPGACARGGVPIMAAAAWMALTAPCIALEYPTPQPAGAPGAIAETPAQVSELAQLLGSGDLSNRIPVLVHDLRGRHPNVPASELVNYLVTAYCPVVNSLNGLGEAEKQVRIDAFTSQVAQAAYR